MNYVIIVISIFILFICIHLTILSICYSNSFTLVNLCLLAYLTMTAYLYKIGH